MPMAGKGIRLADAGYEKPKPLVQVKNKSIMEWSIDSLNLDGTFIFCTKQEHIEKFEIDLPFSSFLFKSVLLLSTILIILTAIGIIIIVVAGAEIEPVGRQPLSLYIGERDGTLPS